MSIHFLYSDSATIKLPKPQRAKKWLNDFAITSGFTFNLNYIFVGEQEITRLNRFYLDHDYPTDILSFESSLTDRHLEASFYVCLEFTKDYASANQLRFEIESYRVLIHGILHFLGFNDDSTENQANMRTQENRLLSIVFPNI